MTLTVLQEDNPATRLVVSAPDPRGFHNGIAILSSYFLLFMHEFVQIEYSIFHRPFMGYCERLRLFSANSHLDFDMLTKNCWWRLKCYAPSSMAFTTWVMDGPVCQTWEGSRLRCYYFPTNLHGTRGSEKLRMCIVRPEGTLHALF